MDLRHWFVGFCHLFDPEKTMDPHSFGRWIRVRFMAFGSLPGIFCHQDKADLVLLPVYRALVFDSSDFPGKFAERARTEKVQRSGLLGKCSGLCAIGCLLYA